MLNVAKLTGVFALAAALVIGIALGGYKLYLGTQIGHPNRAAESNPRPEPISPGEIAPTSSVEAN